MNNRKAFLLSSLLLLTGCQTNIETDAYRCYLGKMMVSTLVLPGDNINHKVVQNETIDGTYYCNLYFLYGQSVINDFYKEHGSISKAEQEQNSRLKDSLMMVYGIIDTPIGYKAYKRDNIQGTLVDQGLTLLTDNFYYYANRPDVFYCQIDLKKEEAITERGTYSFYYVTSSQYRKLLSEDSVRVMFHFDDQEF